LHIVRQYARTQNREAAKIPNYFCLGALFKNENEGGEDEEVAVQASLSVEEIVANHFAEAEKNGQAISLE
jgi:hypothetical protein